MTVPTSPIELTGTASRFAGDPEPLPHDLRARLDELAATGVCTVSDDLVATAEASRDWWPLALHWSLAGQVPRRAAAVVRPTTTDAVARVVAACNESLVPVTAAGGRSGVCGASVPVHGGVVLDLTGLDRVHTVDAMAGIVEVDAGVFGPDLERVIGADRAKTQRTSAHIQGGVILM